jgi:hypothetical protein
MYHNTRAYCFSTGFCRIGHIVRQPYQGFSVARKGCFLTYITTRRNPTTNVFS